MRVQGATLTSVLACKQCGVGMMRTLLPFYAKKLAPEGGGMLLGALETTYGIGQIIGATFLGRVSDTRGRKVVLLLSFAGSAVGYGITALATTPLVLVLSRLPVGLAKQTVAAARAILADCVPRAELSGMMSVLTSLFAVGYAIGPMLGGYLSEHYGDAMPAVATCLLFLSLIPATVFLLPETNALVTGRGGADGGGGGGMQGGRAGASEVKGPGGDPGEHHRRKMLGLVALLMMPEFAVVSYAGTGLSALVTSIGQGRAFLGSVNSGTAAVAAVSSGVLLPWASRRGVSDRRLLLGGYALFALASCLLSLWPHRDGVMYSLPVFAVALSVCRSCPATFLSKRTPLSRQGEAMGLLDSASSCCRVVAPLLTGAVADRWGPAAPFGMCAFLACGGWAALFFSGSESAEEPSPLVSAPSHPGGAAVAPHSKAD